MKFISTKNKIEVEAEEAIFSGKSADGGLFMMLMGITSVGWFFHKHSR